MWKKHGTKIIFGVVILVIIIVVGIFIVSKNNSQSTQNQTIVDNSVQSLTPKDIGLKLEASSDNKKVRFTIAQASDIKAIEYELTYDANATAQEQSEGAEAQVQRGITGTAN